MSERSIAAADSVTTEPAGDDPLARSGLTAGHATVVGLQFGDEGKGQIVDLLTRRFDLVVRYNGGANAGHSVQIGDQKFALHLVPSGILSAATLNVVGNGVVIDPAQILKEIDALRERDIVVDDNLRISDRAHVVFSYHKIQDALMECAQGISGGDRTKIGTTGRGIGPAYADKALRSTAIRMGDLLDESRLRQRLHHIVQIKNVMLAGLARHCEQEAELIDAEALADENLAYAERLRPMICDTTHLLHEALADGRRLLFEGANAALLDVDHGTYPFVTSSHCSSLGVYSGSGVPGSSLRHVIGIVKLYTSRVGGGPFPTELHDGTAQRLRDVGGEYGTTTGRPRRCGWLDLVATRYTARLCGVTALACTGLSVLAGLEKIRVCVGYRHNGRTLDHLPADAAVLEAVEPVFEEFDGFAGPIDRCADFADLPREARRFIEFIEQFVGIRAAMVCVGRRRDQILFQPEAGS
jgi:adenylosuccinate synthase